MAKGNNNEKKKITLTPFLWIGFIIVIATALLQNLGPAFPTGLGNILYMLGVLSMVVYMIQIAFEKRTGKRENDVPAGKNSGKNRK